MVQEAILQRQQRDKKAGLCAHIGYNLGFTPVSDFKDIYDFLKIANMNAVPLCG